MTIVQMTNNQNSSGQLCCPFCNALLPSHARFCGVCGKRIVTNNQQASNEQTWEESTNDDTIRMISLSLQDAARWRAARLQRPKDRILTNLRPVQSLQSEGDHIQRRTTKEGTNTSALNFHKLINQNPWFSNSLARAACTREFSFTQRHFYYGHRSRYCRIWLSLSGFWRLIPTLPMISVWRRRLFRP